MFHNFVQTFRYYSQTITIWYCRPDDAMEQLVEAVHSKPEGGGFDFRCCILSFRPYYGPGVEYEEFFLGVNAAGA